MAKFELEEVGVATGVPSRGMQSILDALAERRALEGDGDAELSAVGLRNAPDLLAPFALAPAPGVRIEDCEHGAMPKLRVYRPSGVSANGPVLVFVHGGCFVFCTPPMYDGICSLMAAQLGCVVVSVDYRLAPEHPFPCAPEDVYQALCFIAQHPEHLNVDAKRLAIMGDSAGGNLATVACLMARARNGPKVLQQVLLYPITDVSRFDTLSYESYANGFLSRDLMRFAIRQYTPSEAQRVHSWASPLLEKDLGNLPPTLLVSAELDVLRDEGENYAKRLAAENNELRALRVNGVEHAFVSMAGALNEGRIALEACVEQCRCRFSQRTG
jgi:acetyl esterase